MTTDDIADFLLKHRKGMPLTDNRQHLRAYIGRNIDDDTIRIVSDGTNIGGVCLWQLTTTEKGELGVWDRSIPHGNILTVHHLVAVNKAIVGRVMRYLLARYPHITDIRGQRRGVPRKFTRRFAERMTNGN